MTATDNSFITIVSGLPRSGTSMLMRMLDHGGLPILTDGLREADVDNPHGYYEFEQVKRLNKDTSWLPGANGKAVKIIYVFLNMLPPGHRYKVLFMQRNLEEVIASQKTMLRHRNEGDRLTDRQLIDSYADQLERLDVWMRRQDNFSIRYLNYDEVLADPMRTSVEISRFLDLKLDVDAMASAVDPQLHRNRSAVV